MTQFALPAGTAVLMSSFNVRSELHGKDHVPAVDIGITATLPNTALDSLAPPLREMLYRALEADERVPQPELDGVEPVTSTPLLRLDDLEPIKLTKKLAGYTATIPWGLDRTIQLQVCGVDKFVVDALQGGSIELSFRIQARNVEGDDLGRLGLMLGQEQQLELAPPVLSPPIDGSLA